MGLSGMSLHSKLDLKLRADLREAMARMVEQPMKYFLSVPCMDHIYSCMQCAQY